MLEKMDQTVFLYRPESFKGVDLTAIAEIFKNDSIAHNEYDSSFIYHCSIGWPNSIIIPDRTFKLKYSKHSKERASERGKVRDLPTHIKLTKSNIIEIHTDNNKYIRKVVVKEAYNKKKNMILVLKLKYKSKRAIVMTVYYNDRNDSYKRLNKRKYNKPNDQTI